MGWWLTGPPQRVSNLGAGGLPHRPGTAPPRAEEKCRGRGTPGPSPGLVSLKVGEGAGESCLGARLPSGWRWFLWQVQLRVGGRGWKGGGSRGISPAPLPTPAVPLALRHGVRAASGEPGHHAPLGGPDGTRAARGADSEPHQRARALLRHLQVTRDPARCPRICPLCSRPGWLATRSSSGGLLGSLKHSRDHPLWGAAEPGLVGQLPWGTATVRWACITVTSSSRVRGAWLGSVFALLSPLRLKAWAHSEL